uniref:SAM-dependent MTase RsmB/NOP-type domain-containing protein n=1 Tax=Peronospora matthiolae TaxID=2874970 RepID=A0AAV1V7D0_9STRA
MGKRARPGRRGGGRGDYRSEKKQRGDGKAEEWPADRFADWVYENKHFDAYYKAQNIVADADWDAFKKALATPLPTTFRINSSCPFAERIREHVEQDFKFDGLVVDDEPVEPISLMPWYPDNRGFTWSVERRRVRKLPILKKFQAWLVELSDSGSITRQEAVSMIPPLVLGVEPHHKVLDMCAAPGSKTSQLLESLHSQELATGKTPTGVVVANDVDLKRAYMLVHQSKRINSPALLVTCHEAQHFPFLGKDGTESKGVFDRILCDVPCSGDGTIRKNPLIWKSWSAKNGIALHPLQLQIAKRGASLLKVGGNLCYSTCTFNPLENEAVVSELLRWSKGSLELVDVSNTLPLLKRRPGISTWKVLDSQLQEHSSCDIHGDENKEDKVKDKIRATMFPPTEEEAANYHLERCMRCLPQDENTGGFFVCLLRKVKPTPDDKEKVVLDETENPSSKTGVATVKSDNGDIIDKATVSSDVAVGEVDVEVEAQAPIDDEAGTAVKNLRRNRRDDRRNKKAEVYLAFGTENWADVREYYGLAADFPAAQLITRSEDAKSVTFVTESITMALLEEMKRKKLKVVFAGLKMFERNETVEGGKVYRVCQAGLAHILPFMNKRTAKVSTRDFQMMLDRLGDLLDFDEFEPTTRQYFTDAPIGSVVCMLDQSDQSNTGLKVMNLVAWRGRNSVNVMATKADVAALLGTMKEMKMYSPAVLEAVLEAKKVKDQKRAVRDEEKQEVHEAVATTDETNAASDVQNKEDPGPRLSS